MSDINTLPLFTSGFSPAPLADSDASTATAAADFESFLTLLTAQLQNQDPLSPLESTEFVAQLASFSAVEQQILTNDRLEILSTQSLDDGIAGLAGWIGKSVYAADGSVTANGKPITFTVPDLPSHDRIEMTVFGEGGAVLRADNVVPDEFGKAVWDGRNAGGGSVSGQTVRIELQAFQEGSVVRTIPAQVDQTVIGIRGTEDGPLLDLNGGGTLSPVAVGGIQDTPST